MPCARRPAASVKVRTAQEEVAVGTIHLATIVFEARAAVGAKINRTFDWRGLVCRRQRIRLLLCSRAAAFMLFRHQYAKYLRHRTKRKART
jgi:hypothetical protein